MQEPQTITTTPQQLTVSTIKQRHYLVRSEDKLALLTRILEVEQVETALIFTRTRVGAATLAEQLMTRGIHAEALHGDLSQAVRETVLGRFRNGKLNILVATDVAARGLDIDDISHVFNYDIPENPEAYIHRIGRTARAGKSGIAVTLVTPNERKRLKTIESHTKQPVPQHTIPSKDIVYTHRTAKFLKRLQNELMSEDQESTHFVGELMDAGYDLQEIAAAAIRLARAQENELPVDDIVAIPTRRLKQRKKAKHSERSGKRMSRKTSKYRGTHEMDMVRYILNVGRNQGVRPRDIVGSIANEANIPGKAIGAIKIKNDETFVDISGKHAERASHRLKKFWIKGHAVRLVKHA
jgi:ATP-dependent RNA helicase DeaD